MGSYGLGTALSVPLLKLVLPLSSVSSIHLPKSLRGYARWDVDPSPLCTPFMAGVSCASSVQPSPSSSSLCGASCFLGPQRGRREGTGWMRHTVHGLSSPRPLSFHYTSGYRLSLLRPVDEGSSTDFFIGETSRPVGQTHGTHRRKV